MPVLTGGLAMRILICSNAYPPDFMGGAELMAHEQAKALVGLGHEVRVFAGELASSRSPHERADAVYEGIPVHRIATVPEHYSPEYLNFLHPVVDRHFQDVLEDFRPDIVHCHNLIGLSVSLPILARQHNAKVVCTLHDFWGFCLRNTAMRADGSPCGDISECRLCLSRIHDGRKLHVPMRFRKDFMRLALDHVDRFISPSRYLADRYVWAGLSPERLMVMPNGIDLDRFHPSPSTSEAIRVTFVGYFGEHKGVATLLDAFSLLPGHFPQTVPPVTLQLVGDGPEHEAYLAQIEALGLHELVKFAGKVSPAGMPDIYRGSDIVVLPSIWDENQPVCLMEAMAAGLPVVASRKGGIPELIDHGENGLMFAANDPQDLAAQLALLITNPELRRTYGQRGRLRAVLLSHERQAQRLMKIYDDLVVRPAPLQSQDIYAAVGSMRRKMADEGRRLADERHPSRYFIPRQWLGKPPFAVKGMVLTGRLWSALRLIGVDAIVTIPSAFAKFGNAAIRRIERSRRPKV